MFTLSGLITLFKEGIIPTASKIVEAVRARKITVTAVSGGAPLSEADVAQAFAELEAARAKASTSAEDRIARVIGEDHED